VLFQNYRLSYANLVFFFLLLDFPFLSVLSSISFLATFMSIFLLQNFIDLFNASSQCQKNISAFQFLIAQPLSSTVTIGVSAQDILATCSGKITCVQKATFFIATIHAFGFFQEAVFFQCH